MQYLERKTSCQLLLISSGSPIELEFANASAGVIRKNPEKNFRGKAITINKIQPPLRTYGKELNPTTSNLTTAPFRLLRLIHSFPHVVTTGITFTKTTVFFYEGFKMFNNTRKNG